ncbi:MAG: branched-chain amino acid ABC transporter permease [Dehalococcoidales bacterium]|nr:branched-chain amino acid ABC transporter permease [Dehalococcoidales bacterium]MDD5604847.1 branched-chain amino acid ABC transporter permease [Dehalococcoidales bacterium]MDX9986468.1 branched-chain amino acid ABC transporter permease [Dehalococcoidales bacterium]NLE90783.1 branched-chain amino acid ABC transporter permease [Dehalococcoidales bacterium]
MADLLQYTITGITVGMVYSLIAMGFVLIWKSSGVANLALGQLVLLFSWFTYGMLAQTGLPIWLGLFIVVGFALLLGWIIERFILRPLIAQPILSLIAVTLGMAYFIEGLCTFVWPWGVDVLPRLFPQDPVRIVTAVVSQEYLWAAGISLLLFVALSLYFKYSRMGIAMRATADDQMAVQACGIPVTKIFSRSWMFACVMAAIGGVLMSSIGGISYGLVETGMKSFSVVILGGLDSFLGAIIAGPIIGLAENLAGGYLTAITWPGVKEIIPFIIIIIVMFIKPYGLFGETRIERI